MVEPTSRDRGAQPVTSKASAARPIILLAVVATFTTVLSWSSRQADKDLKFFKRWNLGFPLGDLFDVEKRRQGGFRRHRAFVITRRPVQVWGGVSDTRT
jgi:hypothetical protein